jgi:hypothetical protein
LLYYGDRVVVVLLGGLLQQGIEMQLYLPVVVLELTRVSSKVNELLADGTLCHAVAVSPPASRRGHVVAEKVAHNLAWKTAKVLAEVAPNEKKTRFQKVVKKLSESC